MGFWRAFRNGMVVAQAARERGATAKQASELGRRYAAKKEAEAHELTKKMGFPVSIEVKGR